MRLCDISIRLFHVIWKLDVWYCLTKTSRNAYAKIVLLNSDIRYNRYTHAASEKMETSKKAMQSRVSPLKLVYKRP